jgi:hypothetical protein
MTGNRLQESQHPFIYEINTWPWLARLSRREGRPVDLASVPDRDWDDLRALGFDAVWLMGVWQRSPTGIALARADAGLMASFRDALPDLRAEDVVGSPYCIRDYSVDDHLGGRAGLAAARAALADRGVGLILDFVPNHVAPDHPWVTAHPDRFITGTAGDLAADPKSFVAVGDAVLAHGRDPYFPAWPDVVQLNAFAPGLRAAVVDTLVDIGDQCDGVRCDMAMLMMTDVFRSTWGDRAGAEPAVEYWPEVIPAVRERHPRFRFLAEAYWDREYALQQQGFDHCYDKRLYDRLEHDGAESVRLHLCADLDYQDGLVRFVENHDEPRAAATFTPEQERAAVVTTLTQTGARLVHDGQFTGSRIRLPVFLGRFPDEPADAGLDTFHRTLLGALADPTFRTGRWRLGERGSWPEDPSGENLVSWAWEGDSRWLVVVNLSGAPAAGWVRAPWDDLRGRSWRLVDPTAGLFETGAPPLERGGDDLVDRLFVRLDPWRWHLWRIEEAVA